MPRVSPRLLIAVATVFCAALAVVSTAGAQGEVGFFERIDREIGLDITGRVESAAWADVDGDRDPDLLTVAEDGVVTLWRNRAPGTLDPIVIEQLAGTISGARWFDADRDGDPDLLTYGAVEGDELIWINTGGQLADPVSYGSDPALSHQIIDVDGDGLLDLYVGTVEDQTDARSGIVVRRGEGYATATIEGFNPGENQTLATLYRAKLDDPLELYSGGGSFPDHRFSFGAAGPRYLGGTSVGTSLVRDVISGDFDGNLVSEMLLLRADSGAAIATNEDSTEITFLISAFDSVSSVTIGGSARLEVEVLDQTGLPAFAIQFGEERTQSDSYEFTLDGSEVPGTSVVRGVDSGLFINARDEDRFRFALAGIDRVSAQIRVTADDPIEVVQSVGLPSSGGAIFDQFYERNDDDWIRSQRLRIATECSAVGVGDFDNDMDLDVYMACGNAIENTSNLLFRNNGVGGFREAVLAEGELADMTGSTGIAVADVDSDGFLDMVVQSSGGAGLAGRTALLAGIDNGNNWLGIELAGRESAPDAVGATVVLETGEVSQRRDLLGGVHTTSQDDARLHFGLGPNDTAERVTVRWPNGRVQVVDDI
ncbi:MAG: CRTAC1 family protein, partial [Actinomycetota bacterium]|nr:CRTAC1 family protein [Actinomycetota bacterium]